MPSFTNEHLLDAVTKRLVSFKAAPSLARADADIFWQTMSDDLYRQLCGKGATNTAADQTLGALQRRIGADAGRPEYVIPRVRIGVGSFYLCSQPPLVGGENSSSPASPTGPIGFAVYEDYLIKYSLKCRRLWGAKQLPDGTAHPTDINAPRMYFEAANALTSLYSGRRRGVGGGDKGAIASGLLSLDRPASAASSSAAALPTPPRVGTSHRRPPSSSAAVGGGGGLRQRPGSSSGSGIGGRPPTPGGASGLAIGLTNTSAKKQQQQPCILDDLPTLRQALCRKFVQTVVDIIGEAGADATNDVDILLHPKIGSLRIRAKVISLVLSTSNTGNGGGSSSEAGGDPAALLSTAMPIPSKRKYYERELQLALESVARGGDGAEIEDNHHFVEDDEAAETTNNNGGNGDNGANPSRNNKIAGGRLIRGKAPMSNKMRLALQKKADAAKGPDYVEPMGDADSAFSSPSMNARRRSAAEAATASDVASSIAAMEQRVAGLRGDDVSFGDTTVGAVRKLKITSKFEPQFTVDAESIRRFREQQPVGQSLLMARRRPPSSSSSAVGGGAGGRATDAAEAAKMLSHLDAKLAALRSKLNDPLEELERNTYGDDYAADRLRQNAQTPPEPLESPAALHDRRKREEEAECLNMHNNSNQQQRRAPSTCGGGGNSSSSVGIGNSYAGHAAANAKRNAAASQRGGNPILGTAPLGPNSGAGPAALPLLPASKIMSLNFPPSAVNPQVAGGANRRFATLGEQDVPTMAAVGDRRGVRQEQRKAHGAALKEQSKAKAEQRISAAAAAMAVQQKETEVQVLSEALGIIEKMRAKREAATATAAAMAGYASNE